MSSFGTKLKHLRERKDLSQAELAKKVGVSRSSISMYEQDEREPPFDILKSLCIVLDTDMNNLLNQSALETSYHQNSTEEEKEILSLLQEAKDRPEIRALFSVTKNATKEDIEQAIKIIKALRESYTD